MDVQAVWACPSCPGFVFSDRMPLDEYLLEYAVDVPYRPHGTVPPSEWAVHLVAPCPAAEQATPTTPLRVAPFVGVRPLRETNMGRLLLPRIGELVHAEQRARGCVHLPTMRWAVRKLWEQTLDKAASRGRVALYAELDASFESVEGFAADWWISHIGLQEYDDDEEAPEIAAESPPCSDSTCCVVIEHE